MKKTLLVPFLWIFLFFASYFCDDHQHTDTFETFLELPDDMDEANASNRGRNALNAKFLKWPDGVIPYVIGDDIDDPGRALIENALQMFSEKTCIKVVPKEEKHESFVLYKKGKGCGTLVGFNRLKSKPHIVELNDYCLKMPEAIQHETMHVMGIFHEQCRWDRDDYIEILWQNVEQSQKKNFVKIPKFVANSYGVDYDYNSLMHYGESAFRKKGTNITMRIRQQKGEDRSNIKLGQLGQASPGDILKMNRMYDC